MSREPLMQRLERLPVPILPTMVGAATLSNVYNGLGFSLVRHLTMWAGTLVLIAYLCKIIRYPKTVWKEYQTVIPASLYAGLTMLTMILGSYYHPYLPALGKGMWFAALMLHGVHILVFTWRNVIRSRSLDTFVPSWFVTYNGIMVSCVVGGAMGEPELLRYVVYYGIGIYLILIPIMIWRIASREVKPPMLHTLAIVLAPCSLCVVSYLNVIAQPSPGLVYFLYACVLLSLLFLLSKLTKFLSVPFTPAFAGMTFPMAIGIVASTKMAGFLAGMGYTELSAAVTQLSGIQIYLTTAIIAMVLYQFLKMLFSPNLQKTESKV